MVCPAVVDAFLSLVYPDRCALCAAMGDGVICSGCLDALIVPLPQPVCDICGHPEVDTPCPSCRDDRPAFETARALGLYTGLMRDAVQNLKFHDKPMLAVPLGKAMADFARSIPHRFGDLELDAIVPIPMASRRKRQRGYNQAERLAQSVSRVLNIPLRPQWLVRSGRTRPQVGLVRADRLHNIEGAFLAGSQCAGKRILVVDDVTTTGSTFRVAASALKVAGAVSVYCLALAGE